MYLNLTGGQSVPAPTPLKEEIYGGFNWLKVTDHSKGAPLKTLAMDSITRFLMFVVRLHLLQCHPKALPIKPEQQISWDLWDTRANGKYVSTKPQTTLRYQPGLGLSNMPENPPGENATIDES